MASTYSIKDLELISGIKAHTLRIWEQRYGILEPQRTITNIRYYNDEDLRRLLNIALLNNHGYKISGIARMSDAELLREAGKFLDDYHNESDQVENLVLCMMDLNEERFESIINKSIEHFGFENTIEKVVFPFLRHLGDLWQVGIVSAAQEHYISNLIRQKLIVGIDGLVNTFNPQARKYLFFLPGTELHELGLLYAHYLTKARGHACVYLGQSVPFADLVSIANAVKPDVVVGIFTAMTSEVDIAHFFRRCCEQIENVTFLMSGRLLFNTPERPVLPAASFKLFENFEEYKRFI